MISFFIGSLAACFVLAVANGIRLIRDDSVGHIIDDDIETEQRQDQGAFVKLIDTLGLKGQRTLRRLYGPIRLRALDRRLRGAGNPEGLHLDLFIQREAGFVLLSIILLFIFIMLHRPILGIIFAIIFSGWMHLWLAQALRNRQKALNRDLPDFLDVLAVTVRSGLPFRNALERVCEHFEGPVSEEMLTALHEMRLGVSLHLSQKTVPFR